MENMLSIVGVIIFLIIFAVALAIRYKLMKHQESGKKEKEDSKSVMNKIIRDTLMMK